MVRNPLFSYTLKLPQDFINVAAICPVTGVLGPGKRFVIWVQGCCFNCSGCISPEWREMKPANLYTISELADAVLNTPEIEGVTLSGGEPMLQAGGLVQTIKLIKAKKPMLSVICYTGFSLDAISGANNSNVTELLKEIDVLIDGPYVRELNDNQGLRGSSNQRIHFLTDRYCNEQTLFSSGPRSMEIHLFQNHYLTVGVHPSCFSRVGQ